MYLSPFASFWDLHFTSSILKYHSTGHSVGSCNLKSSLSIIGIFLTLSLGWVPTLFSLFLFCTHLSSLLALRINRFLSLLWRLENVNVLIGRKSAHFPDGWIMTDIPTTILVRWGPYVRDGRAESFKDPGFSEAFMELPFQPWITDLWIFMCNNKILYV